MTYKADPEIGKLMATQGLPHRAVDRDQSRRDQGVGVPRPRRGRGRRVPAPWHPYFPGKEWATKYTEFNRDEANKMLDALGLTKRDAQGIRLMANGKPATIEISVVPAFGAWPDVAQLVAKDWEAVGIKTVVQIRERALHFKMSDANELMTEIWNEDTTAFPFTGNAKFDPRNAPILTLGPLYTRWLRVRRQGGRGADRADQADHAAGRYGAHRGPRRAGQGGAGAVPHLGGQRVRDRHGRADADGAGRRRGQQQAAQRADDDRQ